MADIEGRYVGESITFPYTDSGEDWIDETRACTYSAGNASCQDAEASAAAVTAAGRRGGRAAVRHVLRRRQCPRRTDSIGCETWCVRDSRASRRLRLVGPLHRRRRCGRGRSPRRSRRDLPRRGTRPTLRADHAARADPAVGHKRLRLIPAAVARLGGKDIESLSRSQRVSSGKLTDATGWQSMRASSTPGDPAHVAVHTSSLTGCQ